MKQAIIRPIETHYGVSHGWEPVAGTLLDAITWVENAHKASVHFPEYPPTARGHTLTPQWVLETLYTKITGHLLP